MNLFRAFLPSWKFFDVVGHELFVYFRSGTSSQNLGEWQGFRPTFPRHWIHIFLNAEINAYHYFNNCLQQLMNELNENEAPETLASYQMIENYLLQKNSIQDFFQFRIALGPANEDDIFLSAISKVKK